MVTEVIIPVMDQSGGDFVLAKWLIHEGDTVRVGDVLCEIETSKANVEIPADVNGVLRQILIAEGTAIPSLTVIALIADAHEPLSTIDPFYKVKRSDPTQRPQPRLSTNLPTIAPHQDKLTGHGEIVASPRAKKLAAEHHVDLTTLVGSGTDGRIVEDDVRKAIAAR